METAAVAVPCSAVRIRCRTSAHHSSACRGVLACSASACHNIRISPRCGPFAPWPHHYHARWKTNLSAICLDADAHNDPFGTVSSTGTFGHGGNFRLPRRCCDYACRNTRKTKRGSTAAASGAMSGASLLEETYAGAVDDVEEGERGKLHFNWEKQWYPAVLLRELDRKIPEAVTILGVEMVVWWDGPSNQWQVFQDFCPHRLAPLSEGRIDENGQLQCSYHGWTFVGDGSCTHIPQAPIDGPPVHKSKKACARKVPSKEHQGMLWVWPDQSPSAFADSAAALPPPHVAEFDDQDLTFDIAMFDIPFGFEVLIENLVDPSHFPFAHHNIQQGNRKAGAPLALKVNRIDLSGVYGLSHRDTPFYFSAPCLVYQRYEYSTATQAKPAEVTKRPKMFTAVFYCVPTVPGRSRLFASSPTNMAPPFAKFIPRWVIHLTNMLVLNSDNVILNLVERKLMEKGGSRAISSLYYTPAAADAWVMAFRRWLNSYASSAPTWPSHMNTSIPPMPSRADILDRQFGHVKHCGSCRKAASNLELLRNILWCLSFLLMLGLLFTGATSAYRQPVSVVAIISSMAAICAFAAVFLQNFIQKSFYFRDYVHALVK